LVQTLTTAPTSLIAPGQLVLDKETLHILMRGVGNSNSNLEHLREIVRLLACLSKSTQNRSVLAETQSSTHLVEILARVLQLPDVEVRRCGATLLANVASMEKIRGELTDKLLAIMFKILRNPDCDSAGFGGDCVELMGRETQRQIGRALALIAETHAKDILQDPLYSQYLKTLTGLQSSNDTALRADAIVTLQHLKA